MFAVCEDFWKEARDQASPTGPATGQARQTLSLSPLSRPEILECFWRRSVRETSHQTEIYVNTTFLAAGVPLPLQARMCFLRNACWDLKLRGIRDGSYLWGRRPALLH